MSDRIAILIEVAGVGSLIAFWLLVWPPASLATTGIALLYAAYRGASQ